MSSKGTRTDRPAIDDSEHYMKCQRCGREFDIRDLEQVIEHETCYVQPNTEEIGGGG